MENKCLEGPYFQLNIMMKLKGIRKLDCPEYLKNT